MKNEKFIHLLIDSYTIAQNNPYLVGIIYSPVSTYGFSEITDIKTFANNSAADMLHLESVPNNTSIDIYEYDLVDYVINEHNINITLRNKTINLTF